MAKQPQTGRPKGKEEIRYLKEGVGEEHSLKAAIYWNCSCKEAAKTIPALGGSENKDQSVNHGAMGGKRHKPSHISTTTWM